MTTRRAHRWITALVAGCVLASCGQVSSNSSGRVTGSDAEALRQSFEDYIDAFASNDSARVVQYVDPACGVTREQAAEVMVQTRALFAAFSGTDINDIFESYEIVDVAVSGNTGTITAKYDPLEGFEEEEPETQEYTLIDGSWYSTACDEWRSFDDGFSTGEESAPTDNDPLTDPNGALPTVPLAPGQTVAADAAPAQTVPAQTVPLQASAPDSEPVATAASPASGLLAPVSITAHATSELPPADGNTYGIDNVFDGDLSTAWNHCGDCETDPAAKLGIGQRLTFDFDQNYTVVGLSIANGYQKPANDVWFKNHRVADMVINSADGSNPLSVILDDTQGYQWVDIPAVTTHGLTIDIESVYEGSGWPDVAISEIEIFITDS